MINFLCAKIGGIWCYWPDDLLIKKAIFVVLILIFLWILLRKRYKKHRDTNKK